MIFAAIAMLAAPQMAMADDMQNFVETHKCAVTERLMSIHASRSRMDRYLILASEREPAGYVQCLFLPDDPRMLCEASSGYYQRPLPFHVGPDALHSLGQLGFSTDGSQGNYQKMIDLHHGVDFNAIATLMLAALYEGYGARADDKIELMAPLAPQSSDAERHCKPVS